MPTRCNHDAFATSRLSKTWFYYFDEQPDLSHINSNSGDEQETTQIMENTEKSVACFDITCALGKEFEKWLVGSGVAAKRKDKHSK